MYRDEEALEAAREKLSRNWVPAEERFAMRDGQCQVKRIEETLAAPPPAEIPERVSKFGRQISEASLSIGTVDPGERHKHNRHRHNRLRKCSDPAGHLWHSNGVNQSGKKREKCPRCHQTRNRPAQAAEAPGNPSGELRDDSGGGTDATDSAASLRKVSNARANSRRASSAAPSA